MIINLLTSLNASSSNQNGCPLDFVSYPKLPNDRVHGLGVGFAVASCSRFGLRHEGLAPAPRNRAEQRHHFFAGQTHARVAIKRRTNAEKKDTSKETRVTIQKEKVSSARVRETGCLAGSLLHKKAIHMCFHH